MYIHVVVRPNAHHIQVPAPDVQVRSGADPSDPQPSGRDEGHGQGQPHPTH